MTLGQVSPANYRITFYELNYRTMSFSRGELVCSSSDKTSLDEKDYTPHETPTKKGFISFEKFAVEHEERCKQIEREKALYNAVDKESTGETSRSARTSEASTRC